MTYEDDIQLLAEDIRRYSNNDARIDEALTQMLKLVDSEIAALVFEAKELDRALVRATTLREQERIAHGDATREVRWIDHTDAHRWAP